MLETFREFASMPTKQLLQVKISHDIAMYFLLFFISSLDFKSCSCLLKKIREVSIAIIYVIIYAVSYIFYIIYCISQIIMQILDMNGLDIPMYKSSSG